MTSRTALRRPAAKLQFLKHEEFMNRRSWLLEVRSKALVLSKRPQTLRSSPSNGRRQAPQGRRCDATRSSATAPLAKVWAKSSVRLLEQRGRHPKGGLRLVADPSAASWPGTRPGRSRPRVCRRALLQLRAQWAAGSMMAFPARRCPLPLPTRGSHPAASRRGSPWLPQRPAALHGPPGLDRLWTTTRTQRGWQEALGAQMYLWGWWPHPRSSAWGDNRPLFATSLLSVPGLRRAGPLGVLRGRCRSLHQTCYATSRSPLRGRRQ